MWKKYSTLLMPLLLAACANNPQTVTTVTTDLAMSQHSLSAYHWQLVEAKDQFNRHLNDFQASTKLKLDFSNNQLNITGGCNNMSAHYSIQNNVLHPNGLLSTMMSCAAPIMQQDRATADFLSAKPITLNLAGSKQAPSLLMQNARGNRLIWQGTPTEETRYGSQPERIFLEVKPQTQTCTGANGQQQCLQVREIYYNKQGIKVNKGAWHNFADPISGYQHNPALRQVLRINRYTITQPAADQSRYVWKLDMVVESETTH